MSYLSFVTHSGPLVTYALTGATIFAETGLLIGFFLPGDSLLFGLGLIAANHTLNLGWIIIISSICAIIGEAVGYSIGRKTGRGLFTSKKGLFNEKQLIAAEHFYERYGAATIVVARFIPVVRTFVPVVAGAAEMPYKRSPLDY
jgi:membrane-associated protein